MTKLSMISKKEWKDDELTYLLTFIIHFNR